MTKTNALSADAKASSVAAVFDLDGTVSKTDTYVAFLKGYMLRHPRLLLRLPILVCAWALYTARIRNNSWLKQSFLHIITGDAPRAVLGSWSDEFVTQLVNKGLRPGAIRAIDQHRFAGHTLIMASASFDFYVDKLARRLGFDHVICTRSKLTNDDTLSGDIEGWNCYGEEKARRLQEHFGAFRKHWYIHGYADHHSDAPFMNWVDRPVAINPTKRMIELANRFGYEVEDWDV